MMCGIVGSSSCVEQPPTLSSWWLQSAPARHIWQSEAANQVSKWWDILPTSSLFFLTVTIPNL